MLREAPQSALELRAERLDPQVLRPGVVDVAHRQPHSPLGLPHAQQGFDERIPAVGFDADHTGAEPRVELEQLPDHLRRGAALDPCFQHVARPRGPVGADGDERARAAPFADGRVQERHHVELAHRDLAGAVRPHPFGLEGLGGVLGRQGVVAQPVPEPDGGADARERLVAQPFGPDAATGLGGLLDERARKRPARGVLPLAQPPGALHHAVRPEHRAQHGEGEPVRLHRRQDLVHQPVPQVPLAFGIAGQLGVFQVVADELDRAVLGVPASARTHADAERLELRVAALPRGAHSPLRLRAGHFQLAVVAADAGIVVQFEPHVVHVLRCQLLHLAAVEEVGHAILQGPVQRPGQRQQHALASSSKRADERGHAGLPDGFRHPVMERRERRVEVVRQVRPAPVQERLLHAPGPRSRAGLAEGRGAVLDPFEHLQARLLVLSGPLHAELQGQGVRC